METLVLLQCPDPVDRHDLGDGMAVTVDGDGMHYFEHDCAVITWADTGDQTRKRVGPNLSKHTRTGPLPTITIRASILCPDCGLHGFVTDGVWKST